MATTIQNFVDSIATKAGVDPATAETAIGTILSAIQQEGDATKVGQLFNQIPGAADLAQKHAVVVGSGGGVLGSLSGLASSVVGKDAGVLVAAIGQLEETNLTMEQIKKIGTAVLSYLKESANPALAKEVVDSIPSLRERFGPAQMRCLRMAQSRHAQCADECPLLGQRRHLRRLLQRHAYDPSGR